MEFHDKCDHTGFGVGLTWSNGLFQNLRLRIGLYIMSMHAYYHHEHDQVCNRGMSYTRRDGKAMELCEMETGS